MKEIGLFGTFTGFEQHEMVKEAVALGYCPVLITHADSPVPEDLAALASEVIEISADFESPEAVTAVLEKLESSGRRISGVFPVIEIGVWLAGMVANRLNIRWNPESTVHTFRNKLLQRSRLAEAGIANPDFVYVQTREDIQHALPRIGFPCVFKPVSGFGKVGVQKVDSAEELLGALKRFEEADLDHFSMVSFGGGFLIEQFIPGQKLTVELLVASAQEILPVVVTESTLEGENFMEIGHALPGALSPNEEQRVKDFALQAVQAFKVERGVVHLEVLRKDDGELFVIEINARCPGGRMTTLIRQASGNNYIRMAIETAIEGKLPELLPFSRSAAVH